MEDFLTQIPMDAVIQVLLVLAALVVVWVVLRFLLRLTVKIFAVGCSIILIIGVCMFIFRMTSGS